MDGHFLVGFLLGIVVGYTLRRLGYIAGRRAERRARAILDILEGD